jgi:hypothetical protein
MYRHPLYFVLFIGNHVHGASTDSPFCLPWAAHLPVISSTANHLEFGEDGNIEIRPARADFAVSGWENK